jgi:hypothetical protein
MRQLRQPFIVKADGTLLFLAFGLAALVASVMLLYLGDTRGSVAAVVVAASAIIFWRARAGDPRLRRRYWLGLGLVGIAMVILGFPIGVVAGSLAALFVLQLLLNAVVARKVGRITLEPLDRPLVMAGAEDFVRQFSAEDFRSCGSYRFRTAGKTVVMTVMAGPQSDRLAVITDKVLQISSRFGSRSLVTTNSAAAPVPADILRQHVDGGPVDVVRAHAAALALLDRDSIRPDVFASDAEALHAVRDMEERALAFIGKASLRIALRMATDGASPTRLLGDDPQSLNRIKSWISA